jgi:hypothetical protein
VGLGLTLSITPVYLVEISTLHYRGMLGVLPPLLTQVNYPTSLYQYCQLVQLKGTPSNSYLDVYLDVVSETFCANFE